MNFMVFGIMAFASILMIVALWLWARSQDEPVGRTCPFQSILGYFVVAFKEKAVWSLLESEDGCYRQGKKLIGPVHFSLY